MAKEKKTLADFKSAHAPDPEVAYLRRQVAELRAKNEQVFSEKGEALEVKSALMDAIQVANPVKMEYIPSKNPTAPCTHVVQLTDLHYGEVIDSEEVDGFGIFSPEIAEARIKKLATSIIKQTETMRQGYNVPYLHILGTGDYISGDIHQELQVTNAFPTPVQAVGCGYMLGAMIEMMAPHFEKVTVDLLTLDNHGRMTRKPQAAEGGVNNWGYVVAHIIKQYVSKIKNTNVHIHSKPSALVTVGPEKYLMMHGHQIRGWAGKPYYGFDRRVAMEAVKRMGIPEQSFTKLLMGHFHTSANDLDWMIGGSLSGTNAFDHSCGRHAFPHQTSWYIHPDNGDFAWTRWWLN